MRKILFVLFAMANIAVLQAQSSEKSSNIYENAAVQLGKNSPGISIGGYGQIDYNQPFGNGMRYNGLADVHRLVLLVAYRFNKRLNLISEIEWEHVKEVSVEQAYVNYSLKPEITLQAGLMLVPMGITNLYHEPTTLNGVTRPLIDKIIVPTTWREIGIGMAGTLSGLSMKYQVYLFNGFKSYDGGGLISGKYGLRKARQSGAEAISGSPNLAARIEYFGVLGLNLGLSAYVGKTESTLYNGIEKSNEILMARADSSRVGLAMIGADLRYQKKGFQLRSQLYYSSLSNTGQYNFFTAKDGIPNDVGKTMRAYYVEAAYNIFRAISKSGSQLNLFVRYTNLDTQSSTAAGISKNNAFHIRAISSGLGWKIHRGILIKADIQFYKTAAQTLYHKTFNGGIAFWF